MSGPEKIGAVSRQYFNPVDAVKLYTDTTSHQIRSDADTKLSFKGTVGWGLFSFNYGESGQINGGTKPEYFEDGSVYEPNTICWA